jgi:hypothetical protein
MPFLGAVLVHRNTGRPEHDVHVGEPGLGDVLQELLVIRCRQAGFGHVDDRSLADDRDFLLQGGRLQDGIDRRGLADRDDDILSYDRLEPRQGKIDGVFAGRKRREKKSAGGGSHLRLDAADERRALHLNAHAGERLSSFVRDRSPDDPGQPLRLEDARGQQKQKGENNEKEKGMLSFHGFSPDI